MKLQDLRNYLTSSCRYLQTESGVQPPAHSALWVEWVVARSLCVFRSVDISAVTGSELDAMLTMQVREWCPFQSPEYYYKVLGNRALVWAWDGEHRKRLSRESGVTPDVILPESVVLSVSAPGEEDPVALVRCAEGYEGRGYRGAKLVQSRWWRQTPGLGSWNQFRMLFDLEPATALPAPEETDLEQAPPVTLRSMLLPFIRAESTLVVVFFALFLVAAAYHLAGIAYAGLATGAAEERIAELNTAVTPVLQSRDAALAALDAIEDIHALHAGPLQLQYLSDLLARLESARQGGLQVELAAWEFQPGGVSVSVTAEELSATELLGVFEDIPWLTQQRVGEDPVKGRMRVTANLVPGWRFPSDEEPQVAGS